MTPPQSFRYRPDVLEQLARHGVRPRSTTPPELVHELISDLYRYEIRGCGSVFDVASSSVPNISVVSSSSGAVTLSYP